MTNWKNIHPNFTPSINPILTKSQFHLLTNSRLNKYRPSSPRLQFANWLKNEIKITSEELIEKIYKPIGYRLNIPTGELAEQNIPYHFYMRVVPKYGLKGKGSTGIKEHYKQATPEQEKEINEALSPDTNNIIAERSKVIAKLRNDKHAGYVTILTKEKISPEVENIDQTTWSEIGEIIKELMEKYETKLNCHDFFIGCNLNLENKKLLRQEKEENLQAENYDLCFTIFPKYKIERWWVPKEGGRPFRNGLPVGTMEDERIAEKLRNPEEYAKIWGKKTTPSIRGHEVRN